jgi:hypothetical protein
MALYNNFLEINVLKRKKFFMKLAAIDSAKHAGLEKICDDNGNPFTTNPDRENYITNFYADL